MSQYGQWVLDGTSVLLRLDYCLWLAKVSISRVGFLNIALVRMDPFHWVANVLKKKIESSFDFWYFWIVENGLLLLICKRMRMGFWTILQTGVLPLICKCLNIENVFWNDCWDEFSHWTLSFVLQMSQYRDSFAIVSIETYWVDSVFDSQYWEWDWAELLRLDSWIPSRVKPDRGVSWEGASPNQGNTKWSEWSRLQWWWPSIIIGIIFVIITAPLIMIRRGVRYCAQCGFNVLAKFWRLVECFKRLDW